MTRYVSIAFSAMFFLIAFFPCQALAASITETKAAIGFGCTASGQSSTAMGLGTIAGGSCSTAMGLGSRAVADYSTAMGLYTRAEGKSSTAMGSFVTAGVSGSTVIGNGYPPSDRLVNNYDNSFMVGYMEDASDTIPEFFVKEGAVGINTTSPSYKLHVNGDAAGTSWTNLSSREFKEDIRKVDETSYTIMLAKLMDMDLTTYKYKEMYGGDGTTKLGFIAEDMPQEVLSTDGKGVDVYELLALTIGAMKAQQKENEVLKAKLREVMQRLEVLEK